MRTAACFHDQLGGRELLEEGRHLCATEIGLQYSSAGVIDAVKGEDSLGRVDADALNLGHGRLRSWFVTTQLWHSMPWGRPSQQSSTWCVGPTLADSPSDRGPSAPSLRTVMSVAGVAPSSCST